MQVFVRKVSMMDVAIFGVGCKLLDLVYRPAVSGTKPILSTSGNDIRTTKMNILIMRDYS